VHHQVEVATVRAFAQSRLGVDALDDLEPVDWLCLTGQSVLEVVGGPIFQDTTRQYRGVTERLSWYPNDVWLYVLAASWARLGQELPFVGRIGERGDEVGSRIVAERLARDLVHLAFLLERRWAPYPKWAGLALRALPTAPMLTEHLEAAGGATDWKHLERELCAAIDVLGRRQAELGLPVVEPFFEQFFDRPFQIANPAMPATLLAAATDPVVRRLPLGIGSIEQWCDNVDVLSQPTRRAAARELYRQLVNDKH
jgi:hypothetical protein